PSVPAALDALVASMLAKEPADRPASMAVVAARLEGVLRGTGAAVTSVSEPSRASQAGAATLVPVSAAASVGARARRWRVGIAGAVVIAAFSVGPLRRSHGIAASRPAGERAAAAAPSTVQPAAGVPSVTATDHGIVTPADRAPPAERPKVAAATTPATKRAGS